jgi:hypothetical protein
MKKNNLISQLDNNITDNQNSNNIVKYLPEEDDKDDKDDKEDDKDDKDDKEDDKDDKEDDKDDELIKKVYVNKKSKLVIR